MATDITSSAGEFGYPFVDTDQECEAGGPAGKIPDEALFAVGVVG